MTDYNNHLDYIGENAPKGTPYTTGFTLTSAKTGDAFTAVSLETFFLKEINFYVQSGCTFTSLRVAYPKIHTSGIIDDTVSGMDALRYFCGEAERLPDLQGMKIYQHDSGTTFFKYTFKNLKPIHLLNGNGDYFAVSFLGLSGGQIEVQGSGWRVLSTKDGVDSN